MVAQIDKAMIKARPYKILGRLAAWGLIEGRPLTTRGRWINSFVFFGYKVAQWFPMRRGADAPIFIVGTGRSGTTVLGKLFAMHRETVFLNEPKAVWSDAYPYEDIIGSYSAEPGRVRLEESDATVERARWISKVYSGAMRLGFASSVVDKYPELVFRVPFVRGLFPNCRFIAILRDGVDTCSSVTGWSKHKGQVVQGETHDWWGRNGQKWAAIVEELVPEDPQLAPLTDKLANTTDHRDRAAVEWILSMREARRMAQAYPDALLAVNYEDLCAEPEKTLDEMEKHCGLGSDPVFKAYAKTVLSAVPPYKPLELMPELVAPFCEALAEMGYGESQSRVLARGSE